MIDQTKETIIPISLARRDARLIRNGKSPDLSSMYRWINRGARGVVLETVRVGATSYTSEEAIGRFLAALNGEQIKSPSRDREIAAAARTVAAAGV